MGEGTVIHTDLAEITAGEYTRVSLGLKPSGLIHLGTAITFLQGVLAAQANDSGIVDVSIMDLDFDYQRGRSFISFLQKPDSEECHELMKEHTLEESKQMLGEMCAVLGFDPKKINLNYFSEVTNTDAFQELLSSLFREDTSRRILRQHLIGNRAKSTSLLAPICECGYASTVPPVITTNETEVNLRSTCYNELCDVNRFMVNLTDPKKVNLFYLLDPIRDLIPNGFGQVTDLHMFGGDYGNPYGESKTCKADRVMGLMNAISDIPPDVYVGPLLRFNGTKLGKSQGGSYEITKMRTQFPDWVERLYDLLKKNPDRVIEMDKNEMYFK